MSPIPKRKLCWQCEGNASFNDENCPYCGVYLNREEDSDYSDERPFTPLYKISEFSENHSEESGISPEAKEIEKILRYIQSLVCLVLGSILALFAMVLFLFSYEGTFTLQWNAKYWYFYLLSALPLLALGWKSLKTNPISHE